MFISDIGILDRHDEAAERAHKGSKSHMLVIKTGLQEVFFHGMFKCYNFS